MTQTINRELEQIEADIKQSILDGDNFAYSKHLRRKAETQDKLFFAETKNLKAELETLESERGFGLSVLADLNDELKQAADGVLRCRNALYESEMSYQAIQAKQFYLTTQVEQQRKDIRELELKLQRHVASKLDGSPVGMETLTNETTY